MESFPSEFDSLHYQIIISYLRHTNMVVTHHLERLIVALRKPTSYLSFVIYFTYEVAWTSNLCLKLFWDPMSNVGINLFPTLSVPLLDLESTNFVRYFNVSEVRNVIILVSLRYSIPV